jgi:chromosome transmission fidelity protein 8
MKYKEHFWRLLLSSIRQTMHKPSSASRLTHRNVRGGAFLFLHLHAQHSLHNHTMPSIALYPHALSSPAVSTAHNPLPHLLHTPSGLAILELQGTFHFPPPSDPTGSTQIGKLVFPLYNPALGDTSDTKWMKRVYMYVGKGQRMTGECKKLGKPLGIVRKREKVDEHGDVDMGEEEGRGEALEIVEVVRYKIVFSSRPEPVGGGVEENMA